MYNFLNKHGQTIAFGLGFVIVLIYVLTAFPQAMALEESLPQSLSETSVADRGDTSFFNTGITPAIILIIITVIAMLAFGIFHIATNFKNSLKGLAGFAAIIILYVILRSQASDVPTGSLIKAIEVFEENGAVFGAGTLQNISAGVTTTIILLVVSVATLVISEVSSIFK